MRTNRDQKKKVLVTGADGFLATYLIKTLQTEGCQVIQHSHRDGDIATDVLETYESVDHVYHLAARSIVPQSWQEPSLFYRVNIQGTVNVLEYCRRQKCSMTFVSTYVYGRPHYLPIDEKHPVAPDNPYSQSKHLSEQVCAFYSQHFQIPIQVLRLFNVFGPGQNSSFLIPTIVSQVKDPCEDVIKVRDLAPQRDYLYVQDAVSALLVCLEPKQQGWLLCNIASGIGRSVAEVIQTAQQIYGTQKTIANLDEVRRNDAPVIVADIHLAAEVLGWTPRVSFEEGMRQVLMSDV